MRILIDTNIFIYRESEQIVSDSLQKLLSIIHESGTILLVHPLSKSDLNNDLNTTRREIFLSKIGAYPALENPPTYKNDKSFIDIVGTTQNKNSIIDNELLYCLHRDAVDFFITEDNEIHKKARRLKLEHRVFPIIDALHFFSRLLTNDQLITPPRLIQTPVHNLNIHDKIFDSLKESYSEFEDWFVRISRDGRKAWVYLKDDNSIGAVLIYKVEEETIDSNPVLPNKKRLKISSLKVTHVGYKIGELFIRIACELAIKKDIEEIYFTYFPHTDDRLIYLVSDYGFKNVATNSRGEQVWLKRLIVNKSEQDLTPLQICSDFYPSFYDGHSVDKYIIPIRPEFHSRLFTGFPERQLHQVETDSFFPEGNTILKAYICHAKIRKMKPGDIILFYLSVRKKVTTIGVVESVDYNLMDRDEILRKVGKRTVYSASEIGDKAKKPTTVIMFRFHFYFSHPIPYDSLRSLNILKGPPQSIIQISDAGYYQLLEMDGIDGRYIIR